jgi:site-specific recombinase XerD
MPAAPTNPAVAEWLDDGGGGEPDRAKSDGWTPAVKVNAVSKLNQWCAWLARQTPPVELLDAERAHLKRYLAERKDAGLGASTRHKDWQMIGAFYAWVAIPGRRGGGGLLAENPMDAVRGPHVPKQRTTRAAKPDEVAALEDHFEQVARQRRGGGEAERARRNAVAVSLMFRSGVRVGELPWIDLADVVTRPNGRRAIHLHAAHTKSGQDRMVPVLADTERLLKRYLRQRGEAPGPLLLGREAHTAAADRRLTSSSIAETITRAARRLGLDVRSHQLRRGFTAQYLRAGGDVLSLEVVGGWADHRMPRLYLADEEAEAALDRFHDVVDQSAGRRLRAVR